jgi:TolB-like protein/DNA-binding SARP family transcriptional activator
LVELRILGSVDLKASDGRAVETLVRHEKRTALLAYLAAARPRGAQRRDTLLALFWPESDAPHARAALNQALYVLRTTLGEQAIEPRGDGEVRLNSDVVWCDLAAFEAALDAGKPGDALALYRGDLLAGFFVTGAPEFERWLERERARLRERASEGAWALAKGRADAGDPLEAARWARRTAELLPADEGVARRLMTFLNDLGDRAAAIRAYEAFASGLAQEYELTPSAETQALAGAIRREERPARRMVLDEAPPAPPRSLSAVLTRRLRPGRRALTGGLVAAALVVAIGYGIASHRREPAGATARAPRVLVLPFQNLGAAGDAYFADGITDEITARLAVVRGLSVIGGQSALRYKGTDKTPRQMSEEVGADYVLEGTVSWQRVRSGPGRVRVRPQLINARDETQVWAAVLDEDMTDLFSLLSGIAERVVDELHVALEAPQQRALAAIPTKNLEAYDYYLRGRAFAIGAWVPSNSRAAIDLLERAVRRDSTFALADAWLSYAHTDAEWLHSMGARHFVQAKAAADRALKLDPDLPDVHMALGQYWYACCQDYRRALVHLERSLAGRPGDPLVVMIIGNVYKRRGQWDEGMRYYERAASLDPVWDTPLLNLSQIQLWLRRYDEAERTSRRALSLQPREAFAYTIWASVPLLRDGDVAAARRILLEAEAVTDGYDGMRLPFYLDHLERHYRAAVGHLGARLGPIETGDEWLVNDQIRKAIASRLLGDSTATRIHFDSARIELEQRLKEFARSPQMQNWLGSGLAICYAGLGRRTAALEQARRVMAANPPAVDAISGPAALQDLALTYVMLGDRPAALDILERLLSIPARFSPQLLRLDPLWDPLRGDPRFERLAHQKVLITR